MISQQHTDRSLPAGPRATHASMWNPAESRMDRLSAVADVQMGGRDKSCRIGPSGVGLECFVENEDIEVT